MPYYTQLIDYARDNQRSRRRGSVHQAVSGPLVVLVVGDQPAEQLDRMYVQISSHWSSALKGLQLCYCYTTQPYQGKSPIHQEKLEIPAGIGAGALCEVPDTLKRINGMLETALEEVGREPGLALVKAQIHVVMDPTCDATPLVTDLIAVCRSQLEELGSLGALCRLYLLLPENLKSEQEQKNIVSLAQQLPALDGQQYEQIVAQRRYDTSPRMFRCGRLVNTVLLLDEWNEKIQRCNLHDERLQLLGDLIENGTPMAAFLQTAGERDSGAEPEYWLAHAMDDVCQAALADDARSFGGEDRRELEKAVEQAAEDRLRDMERALDFCVLFRTGAPFERLRGMSRDEAEKQVFGNALYLTYQGWLRQLPEVQPPQTVSSILERIVSDQKLKELADWFGRKAVEYAEAASAAPKDEPCGYAAAKERPADAARKFRAYLKQTKYLELCRREQQRACAEIARACAAQCTERIRELRDERENFEEFAQVMNQAWVSQRDSYNAGNAMVVNWIGSKPDSAAVRRAGAEAVRTGNAEKAFELVAGAVDLSGSHIRKGSGIQPPLSCRLTITMDINSTSKEIEYGIAAGRVLRFAELPSLGRSLLLNKALPEETAE